MKNTALKIIHWLALLLILGFLVAKSILQFSTDWDYLSYHLPAALSYFSLTTFEPEQKMQSVINGLPPLANMTQGFLIFITGNLKAGNAINSLGLIIFLFSTWLLFKRDFFYRNYLTFLVGTPLVVIHLYSGYIDLWSNLFLALCFLGLLKLKEQPTDGLAVVVTSISLSVAILSKYQTWPTALIFTSYFLFLLRKNTSQSILVTVLILGSMGLIMGKNWSLYSNPVYPLKISILGSELPGIPSLSSEAARKKNTPTFLHNSSNPTRFMASVFEYSRLLEPGFNYSYDQSGAGSHLRMGGFFVGNMLIGLAALFCLFGKTQTIKVDFPRELGLLLLLATATTSFFSQSHDLRYFLYIPLCLGVIVSRACYLKELSILSAVYVLIVVNPFSLDTREPSVFAPADAVAFWAKNPSGCFRAPWYKAIYYAGPTFREFDVRHCEVEPGN